MNSLTIVVPDWAIWIVTVYFVVSTIATCFQIYYRKKEIELKYWDKN